MADWARWDDAYNFVQGREPNFVTLNLPDPTLIDLRFNLVRLTDASGAVVYEAAFDLETQTRSPVSAEADAALAEPNPGAHLLPAQAGSHGAGLVLLPDGPCL